MYRALHLLPLLLAAAPAAAQDTIQPGQSVAGQLSASDPTLEDGSHYDVWRFAATAHHRYRVVMRSTDFDAFLTVGTHAAPGCDECATNDDGAGGTDAQVDYTGSADGTYEIRANSYDADQTGRYELVLEDQGVVHDEEEHGAPAGTPIALGQAVTGELTRQDRKVGISYQDTWTYQGHAGETIVITLRSQDFDAYLQAGQYEAGECQELDHNNNGAGGHDARLTVHLNEDGAYHLHVSSADQGDTGAYTLLVERAEPRRSDAPPMPISPGETLSGRLSDTDSREADGAFSDAWTFRGQAGETYTITLHSGDFDAYLHFGRVVDGEWQMPDSNDDGGGGTDAALTVTVPQDGVYGIRASSYEAGQTGDYTLTVRRH